MSDEHLTTHLDSCEAIQLEKRSYWPAIIIMPVLFGLIGALLGILGYGMYDVAHMSDDIEAYLARFAPAYGGGVGLAAGLIVTLCLIVYVKKIGYTGLVPVAFMAGIFLGLTCTYFIHIKLMRCFYETSHRAMVFQLNFGGIFGAFVGYLYGITLRDYQKPFDWDIRGDKSNPTLVSQDWVFFTPLWLGIAIFFSIILCKEAEHASVLFFLIASLTALRNVFKLKKGTRRIAEGVFLFISLLCFLGFWVSFGEHSI